ncbi:MAG: hypothetical protein KDH09_12900 [Chrysiogenetes bacterium]|nr:hypothetical protein [Chrysiogenetes bacterium]
MKKLPSRLRRISPGRKIGIAATREGADIDAPLWAINWFDYRVKRAYGLYNVLVSPSVLRVGGRLLFKGERITHLSGDRALSREVLAIVHYPGARGFLKMLGDPWFLTVSTFRNLGLKNFVFGFTRRTDGGAMPPRNPFGKSGRGTYLIHQFRIEMGALGRQLPALEQAADELGCRLHFSGESIAKLIGEKKSLFGKSGTRNLEYPLFFDAMTLWEIPDQGAALRLQESAAWKKLLKATHSDVIGIFRRVM